MITKSIKWAVRASGHENKFELCNLCGTIPENHEDPANRESIWNPLIIVEITFNLIKHRIWKSWEGEIFKVQNKLENIQSMHDSSWSIMNFKVSNFQILRNLQIYIYRAYREARPKNHGSPNIELTSKNRRIWKSLKFPKNIPSFLWKTGINLRPKNHGSPNISGIKVKHCTVEIIRTTNLARVGVEHDRWRARDRSQVIIAIIHWPRSSPASVSN